MVSSHKKCTLKTPARFFSSLLWDSFKKKNCLGLPSEKMITINECPEKKLSIPESWRLSRFLNPTEMSLVRKLNFRPKSSIVAGWCALMLGLIFQKCSDLDCSHNSKILQHFFKIFANQYLLESVKLLTLPIIQPV